MKKDHGISRSLGYYYYTTVFWENRAERMFGNLCSKKNEKNKIPS